MQNSAQIEYDYSVAKCFTFTTILFGIIGMTIGVVLAFQLAFPELNYLAGEYGTFSRLRPLHTNGVAFGFTLSGVLWGWVLIFDVFVVFGGLAWVWGVVGEVFGGLVGIIYRKGF